MENKYFMIDGNKKDAILALHNCGIEKLEDAEKLLDYLYQYKKFLSNGESIEFENDMADNKTMGLTFFDSSYYVNLKTTTIVIMAALLDISLTKGFASVALSLFGGSSTAFARIEETNGEKCILKETLSEKQKVGSADILKKHKGQCCYPISNCKYRNDEECKCAEDDIIAIYEKLCEKNVFKRNIADQRYYYQW